MAYVSVKRKKSDTLGFFSQSMADWDTVFCRTTDKVAQIAHPNEAMESDYYPTVAVNIDFFWLDGHGEADKIHARNSIFKLPLSLLYLCGTGPDE